MKGKKWKKSFLMILSVVLVAVSLSTGCGDGAKQADGQDNTDITKEKELEGEEDRKEEEEPYTVKILAFGDADTDAANAVAEAISKKTMELFQVKVELVKGYTVEQLNLMLTSGEKLDLFPAMPWEVSLTNLVSNEQIVPINELLPEYAPTTWNAISERDWRCVTINGNIYGVPMNKEKASSSGIIFRKDLVEELGIDYESLKTLDQIEEALTLVKEKTDYYPLVSNAGTLKDFLPYDDLGDGFGVLENVFEDSTTVVDWYETDSYKELCQRMYDWNQKGLIMPDAASNTDSDMTVIGAGKGFSTFGRFKPGVLNQGGAEAGTELVLTELYPVYTKTTSVATPWCIAANSEQPQKAMQVLDLLYNDPEMANLFGNGIEGIHYVYTDDTRKMIDYPEGKDAAGIGYTVVSWSCPNQQITPVRVGDPLDLWDQLGQFNDEAYPSKALGFVWDNSKVLNEITACQNVKSKYANGLELGALDPDEALPKFIEELKAAGIDTIIEEKQAQLDAWLSKQ